MKLNLGSGEHPLEGFENLDLPSWRWEDGLPYAAGSVEAITVSHSLMYLGEDLWRFAFAEMWRVLQPGGILRITEDETDDPASERFGGFPGYVTLTSVRKVMEHLLDRGFREVMFPGSKHSFFVDESLIQAWHGVPPKVFHIEGRK